MMLLFRFTLVCCVAPVCLGVALSQSAQQAPNPGEEDARLNRVIERWIQTNESEYDHVAREVARGGDTPGDFNEWFVRLGGTDDAWERGRIHRGTIQEIYDRIASRMEIQGPTLSRNVFLRYAAQYWNKNKSLPWREAPTFAASVESDKTFQRLDLDHNGYLDSEEMSPVLRGDLKRWDTNHDGLINRDEYRPYFAHRLDRVYRDIQQRSERTLPPLQIDTPHDADRPLVMRASRLPLGLPAWFEQIDADHDGQIALHEWRRAGWPIEEFSKLDLNDDGFLEPDELLKVLRSTNRAGEHPYAYLLQKRAGGARVSR